jgi:hypothetical protein
MGFPSVMLLQAYLAGPSFSGFDYCGAIADLDNRSTTSRFAALARRHPNE